MQKKIAVVLFNLGGPNKLSETFGFLFRLFYDRAILNFSNPMRFFLALLISTLRTKKAKNIYIKMGGKSPILENTIAQAKALERSLQKCFDAKVFTCMRYTNPFSKNIANEVAKFNPDEIILLPLYPQYSSTTTESSFHDWFDNSKHLNVKTKKICCYFNDYNFIRSHQNVIRKFLEKQQGSIRILFSAHSLPQKVIDAGDPYQKQIEITVDLIMQEFKGVDFEICYQSKVGPTKWLEPSTESCLKKAAQDNVGVLIVPIAFVSEHSETLVELDIDYANYAKEIGIPSYTRIPALGCDENFIEALKQLVLNEVEQKAEKQKCINFDCCLVGKHCEA